MFRRLFKSLVERLRAGPLATLTEASTYDGLASAVLVAAANGWQVPTDDVSMYATAVLMIRSAVLALPDMWRRLATAAILALLRPRLSESP